MIMLYFGALVFSLVLAYTFARGIHRPLIAMVRYKQITMQRKVLVQLYVMIGLFVLFLLLFVLLIKSSSSS